MSWLKSVPPLRRHFEHEPNTTNDSRRTACARADCRTPETIAAMEETGLDISGHPSRCGEFIGKPIDFVISFSDDAKLTHPLFLP
jgi:hypothetical protein